MDIPIGSYVVISSLNPNWGSSYDYLLGFTGRVLVRNGDLYTINHDNKTYAVGREFLTVLPPLLPGHGINNKHIAQELPR
jgi:hypothetical protein